MGAPTFRVVKLGKAKTTPSGNVTRSVLVESESGRRATVVVNIREGCQGMFKYTADELRQEACRIAAEYVAGGQDRHAGFPVYPESWFS